MQRRAGRLRFTEDEVAGVTKEGMAAGETPAAGASESRAGEYQHKVNQQKANQKKARKLKHSTAESDSSQRTAGRKLKFKADETGKDGILLGRKSNSSATSSAAAGAGRSAARRGAIKQAAGRTLRETALTPVRQQLAEGGEDNVGLEAASYAPAAADVTKTAGEGAVKTAQYGKKLVHNVHAGKLQEEAESTTRFTSGFAEAANAEAGAAKAAEKAEEGSAALRKLQQKQQIKKQYQTMKHAKDAADSGFSFQGIAETVKKLKDKGAEYAASHSYQILMALLIAGLLLIVVNMFSSCSVIGGGVSDVVWATSYTAEDPDILGAEEDYKELEAELQDEIDHIEDNHPGYDEYNYYLEEIGHNPYELASYLTVLYENYTRDQVQETLQKLFEEQYELRLESKVERRTREVEYDDGTTGEEEYDYYILNVYLNNKGLGNRILRQGMNESDMKRYVLLNQTYGNRPDIFGDDIYAVSTGEYEEYDVSGEALTDTAFANMINEAEKYLGYPYVWGGSNPSTSFDCSGFVSYVINHCGNGWNVGRQTANGLLGCCDRVSRSDAQPGDLIFFQGTYNTPGASHVGIYVGNGMMIHCGNPISYTSIETSYWQNHFYTFGRIRDN